MAQLKLDYAPGDVIAEKYEIIELLDEGPLGVTYRARHLQHDSTVRLLLLEPRIAGREHRDAIVSAFKTARSVEHKNLIKLGELGQHEGVAFVSMEDFEGSSLKDLIASLKEQDGEFSFREAAQIIMQVLAGAAAVHRAGTTLRAIRPEYVLVSLRRTGPGGKSVLIDVRVIGAGLWDLVPAGELAEDEFTRGDAHYLAPELKGMAPEPTERSDVYSAAVLFYQLLTGAPPVGTFQLPRQRRPDLPKHVDDVIEIALSPAPEDRYPTANDLATDIQRCFDDYDDDGADNTQTIRVVLAISTVLVLGVALIVFRQTSVDPYREAMNADIAMRNAVLEQHARPSPEEVKAVLANHPPNMMLIPAGPYVTGRLRHELPEVGGKPASVAELPAFMIDVFEYPNLAGAPPEHGVTHKKAADLCAEAGKRLCTAEEFEKACRGPENYVYSYGDAYDEEFCGNGVEDVHTAGQFSDCRSNWGVYDISGNFREWTASERSPGRYLVKGGLPQSAERGSRCTYATDLSGAFADETISFRCCRDADAPKWVPPPPKPADEAPPAE